MKSKGLCVLAIDTSGSMLQEHGTSGISKLDVINIILPQFLEKIKNNGKVSDKLEIAIVEIKDRIHLVVPPTNVKDVFSPVFETVPETEESIGWGISSSIRIIKKWKKGNYFAEFLKQNYIPYLVLVTDLNQEYLIDEERQYSFKSNIEKLVSSKYLKFFGIGVGGAELASFFKTNIENLFVTNNPDFEAFFKDIENELSKELQEDRPLKEELTLLEKYYKILAPFFKKHFKKLGLIALTLTLFSISFTAIKFEGIKIEIEKLIEINNTEIINYENNFPNNDININIDRETNWFSRECDIKFTYEFRDIIDNYNLGAYSFNSSDAVWKSSRILLLNLFDLQRKFQINGGIYLKVTGETDAFQVSDLTYNGEFGQLIDKVFNENGRWYKLSMRNTDKIKNNQELAFLRGYSIWDLIRRNFDVLVSSPTQFQQVVKVNDNENKYGGKYRRVMIEMILYDVKEKKPSEIQRLLD